MTKKEAKGMENSELILTLSCMMASSKVLKGNIKTAQLICQELQDRGIIENAEDLHGKWTQRYML